MPALYLPSYAIAGAYVLADTYDKSNRAARVSLSAA